MRIFLLVLLTNCTLFSFSQKLHGVEAEYTVQNGYRYFFNEIDATTGTITQLSQLPILNYFAETYLTNCKGNSVFIAIDSATSNPYYFNFYELDTLGNIVSIVPADTANSGRYFYLREAMDGSGYYAMFNNTDIPGWEFQMVFINKQTGERTVTGTFAGSVFNSQLGSVSENLEEDNSIYAGGYANTANGPYGYLYKINFEQGTVDLLDSAANSYYVNMYYDCHEDLTYGFLVNQSNLHLTSSQYFYIDQLEEVIYPGISISGAGNSAFSWTGVLLPDGRYLLKTGSNISIFADDMTGPVYTPTNIPIPGNDVKLWTGPRRTCSAQVDCSSQANVDEMEKTEIQLYPSPNETGLFKLNQQLSANYTVLDLGGREIVKGSILNSTELGLESLNAGSYIVYLSTDTETQLIRIVIL